MISYRLVDPVARELSQVAVDYDKASLGLGHEFLDEFSTALEYICMMPEA